MIPQTKFDFHFYFVPYNVRDRIFNYEMNCMKMVDDGQTPSNLSLYSLKAKICEIAKNFYGRDSHKDYKGRQIRYPLTNRNGCSTDYYSIDLTPHDLIITSVSTQPFRFSKIFADDKHTLYDIQQESNPMQIFTVFQLDPYAVDIDKINQVEPEFQHNLFYPHTMKPNHLLVPVENLMLNKPHDECTDIKQMELQFIPPRLICINIERSLEDLFVDIMSLFVQALESKNPQHAAYGQQTQAQSKKNRIRLKQFQQNQQYHHSEYDVTHDLSDEEGQIPGSGGYGDEPKAQWGAYQSADSNSITY